MAYVRFWTEATESFIAPTHCGVGAIKLSGRVITFEVFHFDILGNDINELHL